MIDLASQLFFTGKNAINKCIETILEEMNYCENVIKNHFNINLFMSDKDEQRFHLSNKHWIYNELFDAGDNKVRGHCHVRGNYRVSALYNIYIQSTKKVLQYFII